MSQSPAVLTAATSLAEWAHARRRMWSDESLPRPEPAPEPMRLEMAEIADIAEIEAREVLAEI